MGLLGRKSHKYHTNNTPNPAPTDYRNGWGVKLTLF